MTNLEIRVRAIAGTFAASCPELGLLCQAETEEKAVNTIQSLIAFQLTCTAVDSISHTAHSKKLKRGQARQNLLAEMRIFYTPQRTSVQ